MSDTEPKNPPETLQDLTTLKRGWSAQSARQFVIGCGLLFVYPIYLFCVALASGKGLGDKKAWDALQQVSIMCAVFYFVNCCDKEHPLWPALKQGYVNEAIPPEEADFLCRLRRIHALVAVMAYFNIGAILNWAANALFGALFDFPRKPGNMHHALWRTLAFALVIAYAKRSTHRLQADWECYVATRDEKNLSV